MVHRVGEELGLQAHGVALAVDGAALPLRSVKNPAEYTCTPGSVVERAMPMPVRGHHSSAASPPPVSTRLWSKPRVAAKKGSSAVSPTQAPWRRSRGVPSTGAMTPGGHVVAAGGGVGVRPDGKAVVIHPGPHHGPPG